jgi:hypothetical protein
MYNGASYHSEANKMCPLREIAGINAGIIQIHVPFSMANVSQYKARLKWFSKSPEIFIYEFKALTATFDLTWADMPYFQFTVLLKRNLKFGQWLRIMLMIFMYGNQISQ